MPHRADSVVLTFGCTIAACLLFVAADADGSDDLLPRRVASILSERCAACHNPEKRSGGFDLTSRDSLLKRGDSGPAIVARHADKSMLLDMISGNEPEMPKNAKPLSARERADLRTWIEGGASSPDGVQVTAELWSLRPVVHGCPWHHGCRAGRGVPSQRHGGADELDVVGGQGAGVLA